MVDEFPLGDDRPTVDEVAVVKDLGIVLRSHYDEISTLSKKRPDAAVSEIKIDLIDKALSPARDALSRVVPIDQLPLLSELDPLQVSDAALVLANYLSALRGFTGRFCKFGTWLTSDGSYEDDEDEDDDE
jgi:hypothetical protein